MEGMAWILTGIYLLISPSNRRTLPQAQLYLQVLCPAEMDSWTAMGAENQ